MNKNNCSDEKDLEILKQLYNHSLNRRLNMAAARTGTSCTKYGEDMCADYLDLLLSDDKIKEFEQHFTNCHACLTTLINLIEADERAANDFISTDISKKKSLNNVLERLSERKKLTPETAEPMLLAASPERKKYVSCAFGIGINLQSGQGQVLGCVAHIFEENKRGAGLNIIGSQVEEREIGGKRVKVTPPLLMVQDLLAVVFKTQQFFKAYCCESRSITIQISQQQEGFLSEGLSLSLAAAVAVYCALTRRKLPGNMVFSGNLEITGRLNKISHLRLKAKVALENGKTVMVLPKSNENDLIDFTAEEKRSLEFCLFSTLEEVFEYLDTITAQNTARAVTNCNRRGWWKHIPLPCFRKNRAGNFAKYVFLLTGLFFLFVVSLFVTAPYFYDEVEIYNKTRCIVKNPLIGSLFSSVPNYPLVSFKQQMEKMDPEGAFRSAMRVEDLKDYIRDVYMPLTGLFEQEQYENRQALTESTLRFLKGVDKYSQDPAMTRKIQRGLQAAAWIAEKYGNEALIKEVEKRRK